MALLKAFAREVQSVKIDNRRIANRARFQNLIFSWHWPRLGG
jgi:hypothetical protein